MPDTPDLHGVVTVRTAQGVPTRTLLVTLAVSHRCNDFDRALDDALHLGQGLMNHVLDLRKRLGGLDPVIPDALEAFGKDMLHHTTDKRVDVDLFLFHPLRLMGGLSDSNGVILGVKELRFIPQRVLRCQKTFRLMRHLASVVERALTPGVRLSDCRLTKHRLINSLWTQVSERG